MTDPDGRSFLWCYISKKQHPTNVLQKGQSANFLSKFADCIGADGGTRTRTSMGHQHLKLASLPIPAHPHCAPFGALEYYSHLIPVCQELFSSCSQFPSLKHFRKEKRLNMINSATIQPTTASKTFTILHQFPLSPSGRTNSRLIMVRSTT